LKSPAEKDVSQKGNFETIGIIGFPCDQLLEGLEGDFNPFQNRGIYTDCSFKAEKSPDPGAFFLAGDM
jgi:hypothetical protein